MNFLHYGCGACAPEGWINFDASPRLRLERIPLLARVMGRRIFARNVRYGNIVHGLPVASNSCRAVYCSHVLEHLALDELRQALAQTRRLLVGGGVFRFVVPDLRRYVDDYSKDDSPNAAVNFMIGTRLGTHHRPQFPQAVRHALGNSSHRWMWDYAGMKQELENAGFTAVRRAVLGDSNFTEFSAVESPRRWKDHLGIECRSGQQGHEPRDQ